MLPIAVAGLIFISDVALRHKSEKITMPFEELCEVMTYTIHTIQAQPKTIQSRHHPPEVEPRKWLPG